MSDMNIFSVAISIGAIVVSGLTIICSMQLRAESKRDLARAEEDSAARAASRDLRNAEARARLAIARLDDVTGPRLREFEVYMASYRWDGKRNCSLRAALSAVDKAKEEPK